MNVKFNAKHVQFRQFKIVIFCFTETLKLLGLISSESLFLHIKNLDFQDRYI